MFAVGVGYPSIASFFVALASESFIRCGVCDKVREMGSAQCWPITVPCEEVRTTTALGTVTFYIAYST